MFNAPNLVVTIAHLMDNPYKPLGLWKRSFGNTCLGSNVRGQISKNRIFRTRRGNGFYGSISGRLYHERYRYFVPSTINHPNGQPARDALTQANYNWFNILTDAERADYNKRAAKKKALYGRVLYIGEYVHTHT